MAPQNPISIGGPTLIEICWRAAPDNEVREEEEEAGRERVLLDFVLSIEEVPGVLVLVLFAQQQLQAVRPVLLERYRDLAPTEPARPQQLISN